MNGKKRVVAAAVSLVLTAVSLQSVSADRFVGTSYIIDASISNNTAGTVGSSSSYKLVGSAGETVIGSGSGGSYVMGMGFVSQLAKSLSLTIQPTSLVAHYGLDEPSGTLISDRSVYAAYGTMQGALSSVTGKIDSALSFNGSSQAVSIPSNSQTQLSSKGTIEAWIKSSTTTGSLAAVSKSSNFWVGLSSGKAAIYDWTSATTCADSTVIADGSWHHIVVTLDSGVANGSTIYVDGVSKKTCTWTPASQTGYVAIGAVQSGASTYIQYFNGSIDHVKIYNRLLSSTEVLAEYSGENSGVASGLALGAITPGTSKAALSDVIVQTDAGGYTLAISQDHNLTNGSDTIPAISGSIASPIAWTEGATKGLGFTLSATNGTTIPGVWSSGNSYAPFPGSATTFYTRTGQQTGADYLTLRVRADVDSSQPSYTTPYTNTITVTGTITP